MILVKYILSFTLSVLLEIYQCSTIFKEPAFGFPDFSLLLSILLISILICTLSFLLLAVGLFYFIVLYFHRHCVSLSWTLG